MRTILRDVIGADAIKPWGYVKGHKRFMAKQRGANKYACGPMAFRCSCCTVCDPRICKPLIRRTERRKAKQALMRELCEE